jgi:hypothetical protein
MDRKAAVALGLAGGVVFIQTATFVLDPINAKIDGIPLAAANLTVTSSVDAYPIRLDTISDAVFPIFPPGRLTATDKSS